MGGYTFLYVPSFICIGIKINATPLDWSSIEVFNVIFTKL